MRHTFLNEAVDIQWLDCDDCVYLGNIDYPALKERPK